MACPTSEQLRALRPLTPQQWQSIIDDCGLAGATDLDTYNNVKAMFNFLPPPPTNGFQPSLTWWLAANY